MFHMTKLSSKMSLQKKMLSIKVNNHISWKDQIDKVAGSLISRIGLLRRIKDYLTIETRLTYYKTFLQPHMDYCITVWG